MEEVMKVEEPGGGSRIASLAEKFDALRGKKEDLEKQIEDIKTELNGIEAELVKEMEFHEMERYPWSGGTFSRVNNFSAKIVDKVGLFDWLKNNTQDFDGLATINVRTLAAYVKGRIEEGRDLPEGVDVSTYETLRYTRNRK